MFLPGLMDGTASLTDGSITASTCAAGGLGAQIDRVRQMVTRDRHWTGGVPFEGLASSVWPARAGRTEAGSASIH